jgi:putative copper export protein
MHALVRWLEATSLSHDIRQAIWLIEVLQTIHILSVGLVLSSVVMVGLRIADVGRTRDQTLVETARRFMPWFWTALAVLAASGLLLIISEPKRTLEGNAAFDAKLVLIALGVGAALAFQASLKRRSTFWDERVPRVTVRRLIAVACVVLFCAIIVAGRWIAYMGSD